MILLVALCICGLNESAQAVTLRASIDGPSGRCVAPSTQHIYTGSHNVIGGCTVYEWTVTGGTVTGPSGIFVTNGTLCVVESLGCASEIGPQCDDVTYSSAVGTGNGASVSVVWFPGVAEPELKLKVKVKDAGSDTKTIKIDNSAPKPISITRLSTNVFRADFAPDDELCDGTFIRWTRNGVSEGTGTTQFINIGECSNVTVCAFTDYNGVTSDPTCLLIPNGNALPGTINGPEEIPPLVWRTYTFNINNGPVNSIGWYVKGAGQVIGSGTTAEVILFDPNVISAEVCVGGTWDCGDYEVCKRVFVMPGGTSTPGNEARPQADGTVEGDSQQRNSNFSLDANVTQSLSVFPSPAIAGQEVTINLPDYNGQRVAVNVTDIQGRVVYQNQTDQRNLLLRTEDLPKGLYVLTVYSGEKMESKKFMIQ